MCMCMCVCVCILCVCVLLLYLFRSAIFILKQILKCMLKRRNVIENYDILRIIKFKKM